MSDLGKCIVCGRGARAVYPLLLGAPAFCGQHHNAHDAGPFGADFSGPDDFDIPDDDGYLYDHLDHDECGVLVWETVEGELIPIDKMRCLHLRAAERMLRRIGYEDTDMFREIEKERKARGLIPLE